MRPSGELIPTAADRHADRVRDKADNPCIGMCASCLCVPVCLCVSVCACVCLYVPRRFVCACMLVCLCVSACLSLSFTVCVCQSERKCAHTVHLVDTEAAAVVRPPRGPLGAPNVRLGRVPEHGWPRYQHVKAQHTHTCTHLHTHTHTEMHRSTGYTRTCTYTRIHTHKCTGTHAHILLFPLLRTV
jgi:hypothetical protein